MKRRSFFALIAACFVPVARRTPVRKPRLFRAWIKTIHYPGGTLTIFQDVKTAEEYSRALLRMETTRAELFGPNGAIVGGVDIGAGLNQWSATHQRQDQPVAA